MWVAGRGLAGVALVGGVVLLAIMLAGRTGNPSRPVHAAMTSHAAMVSIPIASPLAGTPVVATPTAAKSVAESGRRFAVDIRDDDYEPGGLRVRVGDTVRWVNRDGVTHTVTANDGLFDSGPMHRGGVFTLMFTEVGTYRYSCDLHLEMAGAVVVSGG